MSEGATPPTTQTPPPLAGPVDQRQGPPTVADPGAPPKPEPKLEGAPAGGAPPAKVEPKRARIGTEDDLPEDAEILEMSRRAFEARIARASKAELKKHFGTDDLAAIAKDRDELLERRRKDEEARQAELTEVQKANERAEKAERERDTARQQAREVHLARVYDADERRIRRVAKAIVDPAFLDGELTAFARHLTETYDEKVLRKLSHQDEAKLLTEWLGERVKKNPKLDRDYETKKAAELEKSIKDKAREKVKAAGGGKVSNGARTNERPADEGAGSEEKTFAIGRPNSMSDAESRAELRKRGISYR